MNSTREALVLIGTPKRAKSASASLAAYISDGLNTHGFETQTLRIDDALRLPENYSALETAFDAAGVIVLVFPLYIDSLPAGLTAALTRLAEHARTSPASHQRWLLALCQNGFPESRHNQPALEICRLFCRDAGISWAGGLALGGGGMFEGRDLKQMGGVARNVVKGLDRAVADIAAGHPVGQQATAMLAKPAGCTPR
jgi:hypothetical protein